jgi:hypothetical protein
LAVVQDLPGPMLTQQNNGCASSASVRRLAVLLGSLGCRIPPCSINC